MSQLGLNPGVLRDVFGFAQATVPNPNGSNSAPPFFRANLPRIGMYDSAGDAGNVPLTTQIMTGVPLWLANGDVITNLSFLSGVTAAGTPTNWWVALYDNSAIPALLAQSADQLTAAWAANTWKTLSLSTPQTIRKTGIYIAAIMVKATTVPSLVGSVVPRPLVTGEINLASTSGAALTTTATPTFATPTVANFAPYCVAT